jgi:protocatechuate 3,4-dioxygenase beta subunit
MNKHVLTIVLILLLAGIAGWVLSGPSSDLNEADLDRGSRVAVDPELGTADPVLEPSKSDLAREKWVEKEVVRPTLWTTPPDRKYDLHGIVLGPDQKPFAGANIVVKRPAKQGSPTFDLKQFYATEKIAQTSSDSEGLFRLPLATDSRYDLDGSAGDLRAPLMKNCQAGEWVVVRLERTATVQGEITAKQSGAAIEGVWVKAFRPRARGRSLQTTTDRQGRYRLTGMTTGSWYLEVRPKDFMPPDWLKLQIDSANVLQRDFALENGATMTGRVLDATTGAPIPNAEVSDSWTFKRMVRTEEDGRYQFKGFGDAGQFSQLNARAKGYGRRSISAHQGQSKTEWDIRLFPGRSIKGTVLHGTGNPAVGAYVAAVASKDLGMLEQIDWQSAHCDPEGNFVIHDVRADIPHVLQIRDQGFGSLLYELPATENKQAEIDLGILYLPPAGWIAGRVHDESDQGIANLEIQLTGWNDDRGKFGRPIDRELNVYLGKTALRTDDLGRFRFPDLAPGTYTLEISRSGKQQIEPLKIGVDSGRGSEHIDLLVYSGTAIAGVVQGPDGTPAAKAQVRLEAQERGDGGYTKVDADGRGRFVFQGVTEGSYRVLASMPVGGSPENGSKKWLSAEQKDVQPGQQDLVLILKPR